MTRPESPIRRIAWGPVISDMGFHAGKARARRARDLGVGPSPGLSREADPHDRRLPARRVSRAQTRAWNRTAAGRVLNGAYLALGETPRRRQLRGGTRAPLRQA